MAQLKQKIAFILNPKSGRKSKKNVELLIRENLNYEIFEPEFLYTEYCGHATEIVKECLSREINYIVAVGGDGTVNEVASAMINTNAAMGIIPKGSGNGLARSLFIPMNTIKAIKCLNELNTMEIDSGSINERYFFCTCGSGFDAKIGHKFASSEKRGFISYVKTTLREYYNYQPRKFRLKIDGEKLKRSAFLVTVANAGQYGNNAYISPKSKLDDGKFDVCVFKPFPFLKAPLLGIRLFARTMDRSKYIETIQAEKIVFRKKKKYKFHVDGEPVVFQGPVKIQLIPKSLKVIVPKD
jgi:diacylglycerol kinase (ATP)